MSRLDWLPIGCCAGNRRWPRSQGQGGGVGESGGEESGGERAGGGGGGKGVHRLDLRGLGLETDELRNSVVVLYAPAGNTCLLKLVGRDSGSREKLQKKERDRETGRESCRANPLRGSSDSP